MPIKRCAWGTCKSDSRYFDQPHMAGVTFAPFPKPKTQPDRCREWIRLCNRPHDALNFNNIRSHHFVCSKHFHNSWDYPEPAGDARAVRTRKTPAKRTEGTHTSSSKKRKLHSTEETSSASSTGVTSTSTSAVSTPTQSFASTTPSVSSCSSLLRTLLISPTSTCTSSKTLAQPTLSFSSPTFNIPNFHVLYDTTIPITDETKDINQVSQPSESSSHLPHFNYLLTSPQKSTTKAGEPSQLMPDHQSPQRTSIPNISTLLPSPKKLLPHKCQTQNLKCTECHAPFLLSKKEKASLRRQMFVHDVLENDDSCFYFTGIPTVAAFHTIFDIISPSIVNMYIGKQKEIKRKLDDSSQFIMTLIKLRRGFDNRCLSTVFSVSKSYVAVVLNKWLPFLDECFTPFIIWPSKEVCKANMPQSFHSFPNTRAIIDCTEYVIDRPFRPAAQRLTYSSYKHRNTLKQLIAINPCGGIIFVSNLFGGSISDAAIVEKSKFLDLVEEGDDIMADRGFNIRHLLLKRKATLNIPAFSRGKALGFNALKRSRKIASVRIHVERAIRRMKTFKILGGIITLKLRKNLNQITRIVAFLCNLQKPLVT